MTKLPLLDAREMAHILKKLGFELKRQEGSHMFFEHPYGRTTVIRAMVERILIEDY